jgi:diacylglycerol kinase
MSNNANKIHASPSRISSFRFAIRGIRRAWQAEPTIRIQFVFLMVALLLGYFLEISAIEFGLLILISAMVIAAEIFNTSIETLTDLVSPEIHPLAERTKDMAAAGVLLSSIAAAIIGCIIFLPKLWDCLQ